MKSSSSNGGIEGGIMFALVTFIGLGFVGGMAAAWDAGKHYGRREVIRRAAMQVQEKLDATLQLDTPLRRQEYEIAEKLFSEKYTTKWQEWVPKKEERTR